MLFSLTRVLCSNMLRGMRPQFETRSRRSRGSTCLKRYHIINIALTMSFRYLNVPGTYVDIVKDVIYVVSAHVTADKFVSFGCYS